MNRIAQRLDDKLESLDKNHAAELARYVRKTIELYEAKRSESRNRGFANCAEYLQWLGNEIAESAWDGLSQINSDDSGLIVDEITHFARDATDSHSIPKASQVGIPDTSEQSSVAVEAVSIDLRESRIVHQINAVREFLLQMGEPRTAGSIRYQTSIREHDWPQIEQELLNRNLVTTSGSSRRPRFEWTSS